MKEYLDKIKPYLKDILNNLKKSDTWKIKLTIAINFTSSEDIDEERVMHSKSDNMEIMSHQSQMKLSRNYLNHSFQDIEHGWKH